MRQIVIEAETPGNSRTIFRLRIDKHLIAEGLTAVQVHILVGETLERVALPKSADARTPGRRLRANSFSAFWREDNRRRSNGEQYLIAVNAALAQPVSQIWKGYWQRPSA